MSSLIERYVSAATDSVPEGQRSEVRTEIRAAIDEMVDRRVENGEPEQVAVRASLEELGEPGDLARQYNDAPQYLIGPGWYPLYMEVLKRVLPVALAIVFVIGLVTTVASSDADLLEALGQSIGGVIQVGLQFLLWTTIGFVIAERTSGPRPGWDSGASWTIDDLPDAPSERQIGLGETVGTVLTLAVLGILLIVQQNRGVGFFIFGDDSGSWDSLPLINPDLGSGWIVGFAAIMVVSIFVAIAGYLERTYSRRMVILTVLEAVAWIGYFIALAASEPIMNPEFARRVGDGDSGNWWAAGNEANQIAAIVIIAYSMWDVWEAWRRYRGNRSVSEMSSMVA